MLPTSLPPFPSFPDASRVAVGIAPHGSHRSGLAGFPHPARQVAALRAAVLSVCLRGTGDRGPKPSACVEPTVPRLGAPFPPTGPRGASSPPSTVLWSAPTPCRPGALLRFLRLALPRATSALSLPAAQTKNRGPGVGNPVDPAGMIAWSGS